MATINVLDASGVTVVLEKPLPPGATTASASRPVTLATDDVLVAVVGTKADGKNAATDTTPVSAISIWKQISASTQAAATSLAGGITLGAVTIVDGGDVTLGSKADAKSAATDTTAITLMSVMKQVSASIQAAASSLVGTLTVATHAVTQSGTWTVQPGNTPNTTAWKVDGSAVTQPVSAAASGFADGAQVTLGLKADAKSTATDTTSISIMSVMKQISSSVQAAATSLAGSLTVATHAVTQSGTWTVQPGNTPNSTAWKVDGSAVTQPISAASTALADGSNVTLGAKADAKSTATDTTAITLMSVMKQVSASVQSLVTAIGSTAWDLGSGTSGSRTQRVIVDSSQFSALGQTTMSASQPVAIASDQNWPKGMSPRAFSAAFTTLTRPANTTAYTAADSISNNATAGSVTALTATLGDVNDDPLTVTEILVSSTDTGLAGKKVRAYLFNSDPTASSGVSGGDNAAYSQKVAGYVGAFMGFMETGFSDGTVGRLVPSFNETNLSNAGAFVVTKPTSGAKTLFIQFQAVEAFTPSASSTTIIATARGFQSRAA